MLELILYILAVACFAGAALSAYGVHLGRVHLGWLGFALFTAAVIVDRV